MQSSVPPGEEELHQSSLQLLLEAHTSVEGSRETVQFAQSVPNANVTADVIVIGKAIEESTHFSGKLSAERSGVRRMEEEDRSGEEGRGLRGEELRSEEKDTPCLRISCTALSLWRRTGGWAEPINTLLCRR